MKLPDYVSSVIETLNGNGFKAYAVGGCVRDLLLGIKPKDYDVASNARPEEALKLFEHAIPTGIQHGTITVISGGHPVEVTTFRQESNYEDHRHPESVTFIDSIEEDLARRDFTINAMAFDQDGTIIDPFSGQADLKAGIIKTAGDPDKRFEEDALRMLRAFRFAARYGFEIEPETRKAIEKNAHLIKDVSKERVLAELEAIMQADPGMLSNMRDVLKYWLPQLEECFLTEQNTRWHYTNVGQHTIDAMKAADTKSLRALWTILLHDIGKPQTKSTDAKGNDHFYGHARYSAGIARKILREFGFSRKRIKEITEMILHHDDHLNPDLKTIYKYRIELGWDEEMMEDFLKVYLGDAAAHSKIGQERIEKLDRFKDFYYENTKNRPLKIADLAIDGQIIMDELQLDGKQIGQALMDALDYAFYYPKKNTREDLLTFLKERDHD